MQPQKNSLNSSIETKQNNSEFDNNSPNPFNFQNISNKKETIVNKDIGKKESFIDREKFDIIEKNNLSFSFNKNMGDFQAHSCQKNFLNNTDKENYPLKIDKSLDKNLIDINSNTKDIENNNIIYNTNDENFFNFSFYNNNNNNNNKIINNDYKNKLNENNEMNNSSIYQEKNNTENNNQNENQSYQKLHLEQQIPNIQNTEINNNNANNRVSFFSFENSNTNFKKKTKHKKKFKVRFGDWICPKCENLNFSFRYKCNRCGLSKEKAENHNNNSHNNEIINEQRPIMFNNININYIFNSNYPLNNINIIYNPILFNTNNINNYYGNYNNYQIYYPGNVNIK